MRIPVSAPALDGNEESYVVRAIRSSWISSSGEFVERFEKEFAEFAGTRYALSVCNGTIALHLALLGLDLRPGDEVLVPSLTYIATANAVRYVGAAPVFVDVDPNTWCIDPRKLEDCITSRTKAIVAVHLYGHPADMDAINKFAAVHGLSVIEDAAEAHGARYKGRPAGNLSSVAAFSFYGNKVMSCGEGGAVTLNDPHLYMRLKTLRGQGMDPERRYYFPIIGYNFRLTNLACALLCAQLERYEILIARRRHLANLYDQLLGATPGIGLQPRSPDVQITPWLTCITVDEARYGRSRDDLARLLDEQGIETRPFFIPIHSLPPYREHGRTKKGDFAVTEALARTGLNLPLYPGMRDANVERVCAVIAEGAC